MDIDGFKLYLIRRGNKKRTIEFYINNLKRLNRALNDLSIKSIEGFLVKELEQGKSPSYLNDYICTLKVYSKFSGDDFSLLKFFKERAREKATMSIEEIRAFLELPPPIVRHPYYGKMREFVFKPESYNKWTLFFKILAYSGMRCGEVASLTIDQVDFGRGIFILEDTKTNEPRNVPIAPVLVKDLTVYISKLKGLHLFPSKNGTVVGDTDWGRRFHGRVKRLGIKRKNLTPYSLRHSLITRLLEEDINIFKVKKIVGHKRTETTEGYTHLTTKDIIETIKKDPLGRQNLDPREVIKAVEESILKHQLEMDNRFNYPKVKLAVSSFVQNLYDAVQL